MERRKVRAMSRIVVVGVQMQTYTGVLASKRPAAFYHTVINSRVMSQEHCDHLLLFGIEETQTLVCR